MTSWSLFWNIFILRSLGEAYFPDIIKVITIFIKKIFEDSKKVKRIGNYVAKSNISVFSDIAYADFWWKSPGFSTAQGGVSRDSYVIGCSSGKVFLCQVSSL